MFILARGMDMSAHDHTSAFDMYAIFTGLNISMYVTTFTECPL